MAKGKYWVNNHAHVLKAKKDNSNRFIKNYSCCFPKEKEQQKIADFLSSFIIFFCSLKQGTFRFMYPEWEEKKLEDIVVFLDGQRFGKGERQTMYLKRRGKIMEKVFVEIHDAYTNSAGVLTNLW